MNPMNITMTDCMLIWLNDSHDKLFNKVYPYNLTNSVSFDFKVKKSNLSVN